MSLQMYLCKTCGQLIRHKRTPLIEISVFGVVVNLGRKGKSYLN